MLSLLLVAGTFLFFNPFEVHEAEAATAGRYDWYVEAQCTDSADGWDKQNWTVYGKYNNRSTMLVIMENWNVKNLL